MSQIILLYNMKKNKSIKLTSDIFNDIKESKKFENWLKYLIYKLKLLNFKNIDKLDIKLKLVDKKNLNHQNSNITENGLFSNMILTNYGRGLLLRPLKDNEHFGKKYFHNGWWLKKKEAWFFKKRKLNDLLFEGALYNK